MTRWLFVVVSLFIAYMTCAELEAKDKAKRPTPQLRDDINSLNETLLQVKEEFKGKLEVLYSCLNPPYVKNTHVKSAGVEDGVVVYHYHCNDDSYLVSGQDGIEVYCTYGVFSPVDIKCSDLSDCYIVNGGRAWYKGTTATTAYGRGCQSWTHEEFHHHSFNDSRFAHIEGTGSGSTMKGAWNYCRDPDGEGYPWCYTSDPKKRWQRCAVPEC